VKFVVFEECMKFKIQTLNTVLVTTMSSSLSNFLEPLATSYPSAPPPRYFLGEGNHYKKNVPIQVGSPRQEWEVDIKINLEEMKWVGVD
jgi:hypothetical protein